MEEPNVSPGNIQMQSGLSATAFDKVCEDKQQTTRRHSWKILKQRCQLDLRTFQID